MSASLITLLALLPYISAAVCPAPNPCNPFLPSTYTFTAFTATRAQIETYTKKSMENLLAYPGSAQGAFGDHRGWTAQNGWTNIADYDRLRGTKIFLAQVSKAQDALAKSVVGQGVPLVNEFNDDSGWAALANLRAYDAYGDKKYLDRAIGVWQTVQQKDIDKGYLEGTKNPNVKIAKSCNGKTLIGGTYWVNGLPNYPNRASHGGLNAVSTGLFALLSAELCATTKDQAKYCSKAITSAKWLDNHMKRPDGLMWDGLDSGSCGVTDWTFTYNTGLYISAQALLGTLTGDAAYTANAERTTKEAMITPGWHAANGIIKEGSGPAAGSDDGLGFKSVLVRGLYRSYDHFKDPELKSAVLEYINIQYYGLTQIAADSQTQPVKFGRNWSGPKFEVSTAHSQLAALDVINAVTINPKSAFLKAEKKDAPVIKEVKRAGGCY